MSASSTPKTGRPRDIGYVMRVERIKGHANWRRIWRFGRVQIDLRPDAERFRHRKTKSAIAAAEGAGAPDVLTLGTNTISVSGSELGVTTARHGGPGGAPEATNG